MTVQTQTQGKVWSPARTTPVRGVKGFVIGIVAVAAAATGIGIAVSQDQPAAVVIAPVPAEHIAPQADQRAAFERVVSGQTNAAHEAAVKQFHEDNAASTPVDRTSAYERMMNAPWAK